MTSRFLFMVNFLARNGFYVLIDNHLNSDTTAKDNVPLWLQGAHHTRFSCHWAAETLGFG